MRNNNWNLVWVVIGIAIVVYSFLDGSETKALFGFELNIWVYRAIWALIAGGSLASFLKRREKESN